MVEPLPVSPPSPLSSMLDATLSPGPSAAAPQDTTAMVEQITMRDNVRSSGMLKSLLDRSCRWQELRLPAAKDHESGVLTQGSARRSTAYPRLLPPLLAADAARRSASRT